MVHSKERPYIENFDSGKPPITFRRAPTIKNILAPSRLKQHKTETASVHNVNKGSFRCTQTRCKCCVIIKHDAKDFKSNYSKETFPTKYHLTCQSQYVIYLVECICGHQYVIYIYIILLEGAIFLGGYKMYIHRLFKLRLYQYSIKGQYTYLNHVL